MNKFAYILVLVLVGVLFFPVLTGGSVPIPADYMLSWYEPWKTENTAGGVPVLSHKPVVDDAFRHLYPLRVIASELLRQGQPPLWNPFNASGTPLLAIMHPGYLTPFGVFFLFLPPVYAWSAYIVLSVLAVGVATLWYAGSLGLTAGPALGSAASLVFSGFVIVRAEYGEFLYVLAGMIVLLGLVESLLKDPGSRAVLSVSVVVAVMFLSGQPHMILYALLVCAMYALVRLGFARAARVGLFSAVGMGMAAVQMVPSTELFLHSTINRETSGFIFDRFLLPFSHFVTIMIPNYFGNQATYNFFGGHDYVETAAYIGSLPVFFAGVAVWKRRREPVVRFLVALAAVSMLLILDWPLSRVVYALPLPVVSADVPSRMFVLTTVAICILAGYGLREWGRLAGVSKLRASSVMGIGMTAILGVTYAVYRFGIPCPTPNVLGCRMVSVRTTFLEAGVFAVFFLSVWVAPRMPEVIRNALARVPLVLVIGIGLYNASKFLPFSPPDRIMPETILITRLAEVSGVNRVFGVGTASIRSNLLAHYRIPTTDYFDPLNVKRYAELVSYVNTGSPKEGLTRSDIAVVSDPNPDEPTFRRRERFLDLTGTAFIVSRIGEPSSCRPKDLWDSRACETVWSDDHFVVHKRPSALPRTYVVTDVRAEPDPQRELAAMFSPHTDPSRTAYTEGPVPLSGGSAAGARADIVRYEAGTVEITVNTPARGLLVLSDTHYPGWHAAVDGQETPVYRTNYTFRGVVVPEGEHTVRFWYDPVSWKAGLVISSLSLCLWCLAVPATRRGNMRGRHGREL